MWTHSIWLALLLTACDGKGGSPHMVIIGECEDTPLAAEETGPQGFSPTEIEALILANPPALLTWDNRHQGLSPTASVAVSVDGLRPEEAETCVWTYFDDGTEDTEALRLPVDMTLSVDGDALVISGGFFLDVAALDPARVAFSHDRGLAVAMSGEAQAHIMAATEAEAEAETEEPNAVDWTDTEAFSRGLWSAAELGITVSYETDLDDYHHQWDAWRGDWSL